jgi:hypothetical protein
MFWIGSDKIVNIQTKYSQYIELIEACENS